MGPPVPRGQPTDWRVPWVAECPTGTLAGGPAGPRVPLEQAEGEAPGPRGGLGGTHQGGFTTGLVSQGHICQVKTPDKGPGQTAPRSRSSRSPSP